MCPRWRASISAYMEVRPKCAGRARASAVGSPRPSSARAAYHSASSARPPAAAPVAGDPAEGGEAGGAAVRAACPTQLMPAPHTTATPARLRRRPARSSAKVSLRDLDRARPSRGRAAPRPAASSSTGQIGVGQAGRDVPDRRPIEPGRSSDAASHQRRQDVDRRARRPPTGGRKPPPRAVPSTSPSAADQRHVGLAVARVDGEDAPCRSAPTRRCSRLCAISWSVSRSAYVDLADQGVGEQGA